VNADARQFINSSIIKSAEAGAKNILDTHLNEISETDIKGKYVLPEVSTHVKYTITVPESEVNYGETAKLI
jgi:hypothetical protein